MGSKTVPELPAAGALAGDEPIHVVKAGNSRQTTTGAIAALAAASSTVAEQIRDAIGAALVQGAGITITVDDAGDTITIATNGLYYHFGSFAASGITASEILLDHIVATANTLSANFANLQVSVGTPPAATFALDVQRNGVSIGTISISNAGAVTKTTVGGTSKALAVGDVVTVIAPAGVDASIARLRFTFRGVI